MEFAFEGILIIVACLIIAAISAAFMLALSGVYCFVERIVDWVAYPYERLITCATGGFGRLIRFITRKPEKCCGDNKRSNGSVGVLILLLVSTAVLWGIKYLSVADPEDFFGFELIANMPGLWFVEWINNLIEGEEIFTYGKLTKLTMISFSQIVFFSKVNKHTSKIIKIIYNLVFFLFSMGVSFVVPAEIFEFPLELLGKFSTVVDSVMCSPGFDKVIPGFFLFVFLVQYVSFNLLLLHFVVCCIGIAVREITATIVFSIPCLGILICLVLVFADYIRLPEPIEILILLVFTIAGILLSEYFRNKCSEKKKKERALRKG